MISDTVKTIIDRDYYTFYFTKCSTMKGVNIRDDILSKKSITREFFSTASDVYRFGGGALGFYNYLSASPDPTIKTIGSIAGERATIIHRAYMITRELL